MRTLDYYGGDGYEGIPESGDFEVKSSKTKLFTSLTEARKYYDSLIDSKFLWKNSFPPVLLEGHTLRIIGRMKLSQTTPGYNVRRDCWPEDQYARLNQSYPVNAHLNADNATEEDEPTPDGSPNIAQGQPGQMLAHWVRKTEGDSKYWGKGHSDYEVYIPSEEDLLADDWSEEPISYQGKINTSQVDHKG